VAPLDFLTQLLGDTIFEQAISLIILIAAAYLLYRWIFEPAYTVIVGMLNFWKLRKSSAAFLEITPPHQSEKSPLATQQLFTVLQQLLSRRGIMSLEIISSRKEGIRYLVRTQPNDIETLQRHVASYLPEARFKVLGEVPQPEIESYYRVHEIKQARHYAYPLQQQEELNQSDPVAYITGAMAKLQPGEAITMQMVIAPHDSHWTRKLYNKIHNDGYALIDGRLRYFIVSRWWVWAITLLFGLLFNDVKAALSLALVLIVVSFFIPKGEAKLTAAQGELYASVLDKLSQPLFKTDIRVLVSADSATRVNKLSSGIASSLAPLNKPGFQQLYMPRFYPDWLGQKIGMFKLKHRMPSFLVFDSNILAASELAAVYHFPYGIIKTEGMVRSHSRTLPATLGMKNNKFDVVLGQNKHHGEVTPIGLTAAERERHVFIIGGTGNGKTTMLQYAIVQDIQNGKGVAVVDPHGDMAETLLHHIPEERINDVIYFNPDDLAHPIGMNLLELTPGLEGDELLREKDLVTEAVVSVFRKIFSEDDSGGHRIEYVLRNAIQTALHVKDATLFTVYDLLNDPAYRKQVLKTIDDKNLINFWRQELGKAGDMQKVKMAAGITAKIGRFLFSASAKRILEQPRSTIDFDEILDGKILICNFSKGLLGEDTSELFGIAILAKLQLASLRRARIKQADRKPFYLYVDEFQNFATPSFVQMLSEARKYKLYLIMAEQTTSQQDEQQMVNVILANVGTVVCFRSGNPADEKLVLPLFEPYIEKGEIANLPSYNFYMRVSAQKSQEPLSGETILVPESG
jgi:tRNA isopentenyl-2-thiomethyl-A-37 hydroxylase MiaE